MHEDEKRDPMPPPDATPEEIGEFWDTHSLADYWDETHEVEFEVNLKSTQNPTPSAPDQKKDISMSDETKPDLLATTEDTSNTALDAASDLILDSTIPAPIRRNVLKALDRLGSALIDIPVGALERRSAEKRSESEARIKITEVVNAQIIEQIKVDPEFPQRASNTFAKKILREQYNLETILGFATDILKKTKADNSTNENTSEQNKEQAADPTNQDENTNEEKTIDDDWFNVFEKEGSQKSSEDMQRRFGRVLAGEIEKPGSYSIKAVKILSELDQNIAALFKKLCSACVVYGVFRIPGAVVHDARVSSLGGNAGANALRKYGLGFGQLNILNEYDLIISDYNSWSDYNLCIVSQDNSVPFPFQYQGKHWVLSPLPERDNKSELRISGVALSHVGRELFHIVDQDPMPQYREDLKKFFLEQKLQMAEVQLQTELSPDGKAVFYSVKWL